MAKPSPATNNGHEQNKNSEGSTKKRTLKSLSKEVADCRQPYPSKKQCLKPIKWGDEQNKILDPHAANALAVDFA